MGGVRYYKTNHPDVLRAISAQREARRTLWDRATSFAFDFGGKPAMLSTITDTYFGGIIFTPPKPTTFWTAPDEHGAQRPRSRPPSGTTWTPEEREAHKRRLADWEARRPRDHVGDEGLYAAMGTDWGCLLFAGIAYFDHDDHLYVATGAALAPHMQEILGSEYQAAQQQANAASAARKQAVAA